MWLKQEYSDLCTDNNYLMENDECGRALLCRRKYFPVADSSG
jgi:hypothetical protein